MSKLIVRVGLLMIGLLLAQAAAAPPARAQEKVQEEFHQTYQLAPQGRVQVENINGSVRITGWDRNEVKVDAVKSAYTRERLAEAEIIVEASAASIRIYTKYPDRNMTFNNEEGRRLNNPASVEYTLFVPRAARLDSAEVINGGLSIDGLSGDVMASSINGNVTARGLMGEAKLSTVNGNLDATFNRLEAAKSISLTSVNGNVTITIPSDASANLRANNVHGGIRNDFGLPVRKGEFVGYDLAGQLGQGETRIKLANVNGVINIRRAQDGRSLSQATNFLNMTEGDNSRADKEAFKQSKMEEREIARAQAEVARATRNIQRDIARATAETQSASTSIARGMGVTNYRVVQRDSKSFTVSGTPRIRVETFDGPLNVRAWDKPEVSYTVTKRAVDEESAAGIRITSEQRNDEVIIRAEFDRATASRMGGNVQAEAGIDLFVPRSSHLLISTGDGPLNIEGVSGEVKAATGDGAVDIHNTRGNLIVQTGDGRIRISNFNGAALVSTGDGGISLDGQFTQLKATTGDGSISLALPEGANATIETEAETVTTDGLATSEDNDETKRVRRWRVGSGGTLLTLKTGDGRITLRRTDGSQ